MPETVQLYNALWGLGTGLLTLGAIWLIINNAWWRKALGDEIPATDDTLKPPPSGEVHEFGPDLAEAHGRPTLFIKLLAVGFVIWAIGYVALIIAEFGFNVI